MTVTVKIVKVVIVISLMQQRTVNSRIWSTKERLEMIRKLEPLPGTNVLELQQRAWGSSFRERS